MANAKYTGTETPIVLGGESYRNTAAIRRRIGTVISQMDMGGTETVYAYTQTFKCLRNKRPRAQFKETIVFLTKTLARSCLYTIIPEWRYTTGEIHYHGILCIKDSIKWFKQTLPTLRYQGYICLKPIDNLEKWIDYIVKQAYIAEGILTMDMPISQEMVYEPYKTETLDNPPNGAQARGEPLGSPAVCDSDCGANLGVDIQKINIETEYIDGSIKESSRSSQTDPKTSNEGGD